MTPGYQIIDSWIPDIDHKVLNVLLPLNTLYSCSNGNSAVCQTSVSGTVSRQFPDSPAQCPDSSQTVRQGSHRSVRQGSHRSVRQGCHRSVRQWCPYPGSGVRTQAVRDGQYPGSEGRSSTQGWSSTQGYPVPTHPGVYPYPPTRTCTPSLHVPIPALPATGYASWRHAVSSFAISNPGSKSGT